MVISKRLPLCLEKFPMAIESKLCTKQLDRGYQVLKAKHRPFDPTQQSYFEQDYFEEREFRLNNSNVGAI